MIDHSVFSQDVQNMSEEDKRKAFDLQEAFKYCPNFKNIFNLVGSEFYEPEVALYKSKSLMALQV